MGKGVAQLCLGQNETLNIGVKQYFRCDLFVFRIIAAGGNHGHVATCNAAAAPRRIRALCSWRRALARDQPISATNWSKISPRPYFEAQKDSAASFFVIFLRADFRQPITHPSNTPRAPDHDQRLFASTSYMRHAPQFARTLDESHRSIDIISDTMDALEHHDYSVERHIRGSSWGSEYAV